MSLCIAAALLATIGGAARGADGPTGTVKGRVAEADTKAPLAGASVTLQGTVQVGQHEEAERCGVGDPSVTRGNVCECQLDALTSRARWQGIPLRVGKHTSVPSDWRAS